MASAHLKKQSRGWSGPSRGMPLSDPTDGVETIVDPKDAAETAGLRYVSDARPGILRRKSGKGFVYFAGRWVEAHRDQCSEADQVPSHPASMDECLDLS